MPASAYTQKKTKGHSYRLERQISAELKDKTLPSDLQYIPYPSLENHHNYW